MLLVFELSNPSLSVCADGSLSPVSACRGGSGVSFLFVSLCVFFFYYWITDALFSSVFFSVLRELVLR